jgi:F420H(2)-dependent quinone reductase
MSKTYQLTPLRLLANLWMHLFIRLGVAPPHYYLLGVRGRRTGRIHATPVWLVENGERYLVAPYGAVNWVKNARASRIVTLTRGLRSETRRVVELDPQRSAPVLKIYLTHVSVVRPFFGVRADSTLEAFVAEASRHPVFQLR